MSLNHKKIANTKYGVKEVLKRLEGRAEEFVELLVRARPEDFGGDSDTVIDPFVIIGLMTVDLQEQFQSFSNKIKSGELTIPDSVRERVKEKIQAEVINIDTGKKKTDTTH